LLDNLDGSDLYNLPQKIVKAYFSKFREDDAMLGTRADVSIWDAALKDKKLMRSVADSFRRKTDVLAKKLLEWQKGKPRDLRATAQLLTALIQGAAIQKMIDKEFDIDSYEDAVIRLLMVYTK
jgi:hypothetical protein